ncbi:signal peptidase II [Cycloclasticus sp.]|uniref:signal peptidase II n=1 Tax=Cycloclasticus sp. TaxID=2024830 RepID=UPI000C0F585A|nr:signal peptidase II [Cycloclasticus sp.]PHR51834.1 MAG: signal peptidase II [Cycloclasticus sp.]
MFKWLGLSLLVIVLDQVSKLWVVASFSLYESIDVMPFVNLTYVHNKGAAFSFLSTAGGWQRWFFVAIASIATLILVIWLSRLKPKEKWMAVSLSLILGGAIGNLYDRVAYGYVIDFIDVYYNSYHWPVFNIADSAISIGVVMMLIDMIRGEDSTASQ